jgi:hypothetical protein
MSRAELEGASRTGQRPERGELAQRARGAAAAAASAPLLRALLERVGRSDWRSINLWMSPWDRGAVARSRIIRARSPMVVGGQGAAGEAGGRLIGGPDPNRTWCRSGRS